MNIRRRKENISGSTAVNASSAVFSLESHDSVVRTGQQGRTEKPPFFSISSPLFPVSLSKTTEKREGERKVNKKRRLREIVNKREGDME
jgi:hypothetical protein